VNEILKELKQKYAQAEEKYSYFLLAVAASAVAFAVQKTEAAKLTWTLFPMALAVIAWGASFYFGCRHLVFAQNTMISNYELLTRKDKATIKSAQEDLYSDIKNANCSKELQFLTLILGAIFFLIWHIIGIVLRTFP